MRRASLFLGIGMVAASFSAPAVRVATAASAREALTALLPVQRNEVTMDVVAEADIDNCRLEKIDEAKLAGYEVFSPTGTILRRFLDTNNDRKLDVWCYYAGGVEVYRDIDSDFNGKADQYRWLGTAGSRWAIDANEDQVIDSWKRISAQEATAEVIAALGNRDANRFQRVLPQANEIAKWGVGDEMQKKLVDRVEAARKGFADLATSQKVVQKTSRWSHFAANNPGIVPAGTNGSQQDITVYEGVVAMIETDGKPAQVFIGTMVETEAGWRLVELPVPISEDQPLTDVAGVFFSGRAKNPVDGGSKMNSGTEALVADLEKIDRQMAVAKKPEEIARLHADRAATLEKIAEASTGADRDIWYRQLIETVASAANGGDFPAGKDYLAKLSDRVMKNQPSLHGYAKYQAVFAEYLARQGQPKPDLPKIQQWWLDQLDTFVREFPNDPQAAEAYRQLGFNKEFEGEEAEALKWYRQAAAKFSTTDAGKISAGAVRRLESVGKTLDLKGTTLDGKPFSIKDLQGRPIVVQYWASWCEPCKQDMKLLAQLESRYKDRSLAVVCINVDDRKEDALKHVRDNRIAWPQLHEPGGLESGLATQLGVQTLPMMLLIDASGKVVQHSVQAAELDAAILKLSK